MSKSKNNNYKPQDRLQLLVTVGGKTDIPNKNGETPRSILLAQGLTFIANQLEETINIIYGNSKVDHSGKEHKGHGSVVKLSDQEKPVVGSYTQALIQERATQKQSQCCVIL